ncbi:hypothetical protein ATANTOWER_023338, partial [Ataeniobius toweri]|nr:hypothetical protein [Ataeniobius toweri]
PGGGWNNRAVLSWKVDRQVSEQQKMVGYLGSSFQEGCQRSVEESKEMFLQSDARNKDAYSKSPVSISTRSLVSGKERQQS